MPDQLRSTRSNLPPHSTLALHGAPLLVPAGVHLNLSSSDDGVGRRLSSASFSAGGATIDGGGVSRLIQVEGGGQLVLSYVHLTRGRLNSANGAGLLVSGPHSSVTLLDVRVSHCHADGSGNGGAIAGEDGATIYAINMDVFDCSSGAKGGGLFTTVRARMTPSVFYPSPPPPPRAAPAASRTCACQHWSVTARGEPPSGTRNKEHGLRHAPLVTHPTYALAGWERRSRRRRLVCAL